MPSIGSWDEIIDEADGERFVGREQELDTFRRQISLAHPRYLIFYISGQGGVGKTTLLNRFRDIAKDLGFLLTDADEQQHDIPTILGRFAHQLAEQGFPLKHFDERYKVYRQKMKEIENDPDAPQGWIDALTRTVVRSTYIVGDMVPGVRKGLEYLPRDVLENQASEWMAYLAKKWTNKDETELVRDPVPVLSSLFFEDLNEIAQKHKILLCFENFEATRHELQPWLLHLKEYHPCNNIRIAIAGRDLPGPQWDVLRAVTLTFRLDVFSKLEAEDFLDIYGISNTKRREEILELSGLLPVLMSWLATPEGDEPDSSLPTHDIVERFLRWVTDPSLREAALLAAIPRSFNLDILKLLLDTQTQAQVTDVQAIFDWLQTMPFVRSRLGGWQYHDVVRRMMLLYQAQKSPENYKNLHAFIADSYQQKYEGQSFLEKPRWTNEQWRKDALSYAYHHFLADPVNHWAEILSLFALAIHKRRTFANEILELLCLDEARNELSQKQNDRTTLFKQQLQIIENKGLEYGFQMFDTLYHMKNLDERARSYMLAHRGICHRFNKNYEAALKDFITAANSIPDDSWILTHKGIAFRNAEKYQEAMDDFNKAIDLDANSEWAIAQRAQSYKLIKQYEKALNDFDRAIELNQTYDWAIAHRGETYQLMKRYDDALRDLNHAIALNANHPCAFSHRGDTYRYMERYDDALADFNHAITTDPTDDYAFAHRGLIYGRMGRYEDALKDLNHAIALNANHTCAFSHRSDIYRKMRCYEDALADSNHTIAINPKDDYSIAHRGEIYRKLDRYEEALKDLNHAIALNANHPCAFSHRGDAYLDIGQYEDALTDFNHAIIINPTDDYAFAHRGHAYSRLGLYEKALADFAHAITLNKNRHCVFSHRAETYQKMGRYKEALLDFEHATALGIHVSTLNRGLLLSYLKRYAEALACYEEGLKKAPDDYSLLYNVAVVMARWKGFSESQQHIDKARTALQAVIHKKNHGRALYGLGGLEALAGNTDSALDYLEQAIPLSKKVTNWAQHDIAWLDLRTNPRFQSLLSSEKNLSS